MLLSGKEFDFGESGCAVPLLFQTLLFPANLATSGLIFKLFVEVAVVSVGKELG